jgi:hypothetical protein
MPRPALSTPVVLTLLVVALAAGLGIGALTGRIWTDGGSGSETPTTPPATQTESAAAGLTIEVDKMAVARDEQVTITGSLAPPSGGVTVFLERSVDGAEFEAFPVDPRTTEDDGGFKFTARSGRQGQNTFRVTAPELGAISQEVSVQVNP